MPGKEKVNFSTHLAAKLLRELPRRESNNELCIVTTMNMATIQPVKVHDQAGLNLPLAHCLMLQLKPHTLYSLQIALTNYSKESKKAETPLFYHYIYFLKKTLL